MSMHEHDEEEEAEVCNHPGCVALRERMTDDFYALWKHAGNEMPDNPPTLSKVASKISEMAAKKGDTPVFRFAMIFVDENGSQQIMSSHMGTYETINLLTRAVSILAYQEQQKEDEQADMMANLGNMIGRQMAGQAVPDFIRDLVHNGQMEDVELPPNDVQNVADNPGGYL